MTFWPVRAVFLLRLFDVCRSVKKHCYYFPVLSPLMYRLINWKPRLYATRWTLCGTRHSPTVESQRKTCTAKHSGKCLLQRLPCYFCLLHFLPLCSILSSRRPTLADKRFLIIHLSHRVFCLQFIDLYHFSLSMFPPFLSPLILHLCHRTFLPVFFHISPVH